MEIENLVGCFADMDMNLSSKRIGFTCSCFDLFHAGHYLMLKDAKAQCDILVVGLQTDPTLDEGYRMATEGKNKNKPIQSWEERLEQVRGCRYVDYVVRYSTEEDLLHVIKLLKPDVRVLGSDWQGKLYTGHELNVPIHWHNRDHDWSTSNLRKRIYEAELAKREHNIQSSQ